MPGEPGDFSGTIEDGGTVQEPAKVETGQLYEESSSRAKRLE